MKQIRVVLTCDEGFVADTMRNVATMIEDEERSWYEAEHGSGFTEEIEVPEPEPSLEEIFDAKAEKVLGERERKLQELRMADLAERAWIADTVGKLEFLEKKGFTVKPYYGGIVDGWPYNYINVKKNGGRWVGIKGSSVRNDNGQIDHLSPFIYNTERHTLESLIKKIAEW